MLFARDVAAIVAMLAVALVAATAILLGGDARPHHATGAMHGMAMGVTGAGPAMPGPVGGALNDAV